MNILDISHHDVHTIAQPHESKISAMLMLDVDVYVKYHTGKDYPIKNEAGKWITGHYLIDFIMFCNPFGDL